MQFLVLNPGRDRPSGHCMNTVSRLLTRAELEALARDDGHVTVTANLDAVRPGDHFRFAVDLQYNPATIVAVGDPDEIPSRRSRSDLEYGTIALSSSGRSEPDPYPPVPERWRHEAAVTASPSLLALFLLTRADDIWDYDEHDGAVVRAADEAEARRLVADLRPTRVWGAAAGVACTRLGAADGGDAAIVLASFNAG